VLLRTDLETTEQINDISDALKVYIAENDAVEMFNMSH